MPSEHRCLQCNLSFLHKSKLQRHMEVHLITGDWLCGLCDILVNRLAALTLHWKNACPEMKIVFGEANLKQMSSEELQEAAFRHTLDKFSLEQGPSNEEDLVEVEESDLSPCIYCNLHLPREVLQNHYKVHVNKILAGKNIRNSPIPYICDVCGFGFRLKKSLIYHWRTKCSELLAFIPEDVHDISNEDLREIVQGVVKRAERFIPVHPVAGNEEEEVEIDVEEGLEDVETSDKFIGPINPPDTPDFKEKWAVGQKTLDIHECSQCDLGFVSIGRKNRHENMIHSREKSVVCELCKTKFKQNKLLIAHLRDNCRAMKVEEPDAKKRKRMTKQQLMEVVEEGKQRWQELFEKKKEQNLKFIEQFLSDLDRKRDANRRDPRPLLPSTSARSEASESVSRACEFCKVVFSNSRFLQLHQQTVHQNERPRNQLTVTASSLLPYFKLDTATFYDSDGEEHKMGKLLERDSDLAKHLKDKFVESGRRANEQQKECFVVELQGNEQAFVVLNEQEFGTVCTEDGTLRRLFFENPKTFDDWPVLQREC